MRKILITIGQNQFTKQQINSLEKVAIDNYHNYIIQEKALVIWNFVSKGNAYSDYKEKHPAIITFGCNDYCTQEQRNSFFKCFTQQWVAITQQDINDIVIGALDEATFSNFISRNSKQLSLMGKLKFYSVLLLQTIQSKITKGYIAFNSSLKK